MLSLNHKNTPSVPVNHRNTYNRSVTLFRQNQEVIIWLLGQGQYSDLPRFQNAKEKENEEVSDK
jgi:hypothetical protein